MANVLKEEKKQQVLALGRLGCSLRRIQQATHVRRETASAPESGGDRSAPRWKTGANSWVTRPPSAPCSTASCTTATCSSAARGAGEPKRKHRNTESQFRMCTSLGCG